MGKKNEGITLIALIITIVILIILTAITINSITSTNLFGLARGAAENYIQAGKDEEKAIDDMISEVQEIEKGLGRGGTDGGTEEETEDEDLYRYILGEGKTGRSMDEISNYTDFLDKWDINNFNFKKDEKMETDFSTSIKALDVGYPEVWKEEKPIDYVYIKYENKVYRITVEENNNNQTTDLKKVYEQTGLEGQTVEYSYDGSEQNKKSWTIIKDNKNGTVDIVSPTTLDTLALGQNGSTSSDQTNAELNQTIDEYNKAIEKINQKCQTLVTNKDNGNVTKVRSVGAEKDNSGTYTSNRITEWAETHTYLSNYNGKGKTGDMYYEDDLVRMNYHNVVTTETPYWLASRSVGGGSSGVNFFVAYVSEDGLLLSDYLWGVGSGGNVNSSANSHGVRPVVTIEYPISGPEK